MSGYIIKNMITARILLLQVVAAVLVCSMTGDSAYSEEKKNVTAAETVTRMRGLYIPNRKGRSLNFMKSVVEKGKPLGINMLVIDVQSGSVLKIDRSVVNFLKEEKIYTVARVVCFQDGIDRLPVSRVKIKRLLGAVKESAESGFNEVQLDYIRFQDGGTAYPLKKKYAVIEEMLKEFREIADRHGVLLSADIFGRIVYNKNDFIGQKLEVFAGYMDVIYPMLYPSHYTGDRQRMSSPGDTVKEGTLKGIVRLKGKKVEIQPYIQAFPYNIRCAGVTLDGYVALQIKGVEETGARGWVAWNPNGDYSSVFTALGKIEKAE